MASIHQVNHPGRELDMKFKIREKHSQDYYFFPNSQTNGVRLWNRCFIGGQPNSHKRKFIEHRGKSVASLSSRVEEEHLLRFWGEYEGHSEFERLTPKDNTPYWDNPSAIHKPFFCNQKANDQNTDPYIFGENLYYAICKKAQLKDIGNGDLILFGSEFGPKGNVQFHLDTLFVVERSQPSILDSTFYDYTYQESTLKQIGLSNCTHGTLPIHVGKKYSPGCDVFSFFPAKQAAHRAFGRPRIDTERLGLQKPGARTGAKSRRLSEDEDCREVWTRIATEVIKQGFVLGTHADQLPILEKLP